MFGSAGFDVRADHAWGGDFRQSGADLSHRKRQALRRTMWLRPPGIQTSAQRPGSMTGPPSKRLDGCRGRGQEIRPKTSQEA